MSGWVGGGWVGWWWVVGGRWVVDKTKKMLSQLQTEVGVEKKKSELKPLLVRMGGWWVVGGWWITRK